MRLFFAVQADKKYPFTNFSCTSTFLSFDSLRQKTLEVNIYGVRRRDGQQSVFPYVHFTCSGNLTKWMGGEIGNTVGTELQIWRKSSIRENSYTKIGSSVLQANDSDNDHVYEYTPNPPLEFQEGDILRVYQRGGGGL